MEALQSQGQWRAAQEAAWKALEHCPPQQGALRIELSLRIARLDLLLERPQDALSLLEQLQRGLSQAGITLPTALKLRLEKLFARSCHLCQHYARARHHYQRVCQIEPSVAHYLALADFEAEMKQIQAALKAYRHALRQPLASRKEKALLTAQQAQLYKAQNAPERAVQVLQEAAEIYPLAIFKLAQASVFPLVYPDAQALHSWSEQASHCLQELETQNWDWQNLEQLSALPFYLTYQGHNVRPFMSRYGQLIQQHLPALTLPKLRSKRGRRLKVGCLSRFLYAHSIPQCFIELALGLADDDLELHLLALDDSPEDAFARRLQARAPWHRLRGKLQDKIQQLRAMQFDALIFLDMGLEPTSYLMAQYRLAPLQLLFPGQPATSGVPQMDWAITDKIAESPQAQAHYSEKMIRLEHTTFIYHAPPYQPTGQDRRARWGFKAEDHLYICPGKVFKLSLQMDRIFAQILNQDARAKILLIDFGPPGVMEDYLQRLNAQLSPHERARVVILPRLDSQDFGLLLESVDLMLETYPFGSANTLMMAMAAGCPILSWPSPYLSGRCAYTLFQILELTEAIVYSEAEYVQTALRWATNKGEARRLGALFQSRCARLIQQPHGVPSLRQHLHDHFGDVIFA